MNTEKQLRLVDSEGQMTAEPNKGRAAQAEEKRQYVIGLLRANPQMHRQQIYSSVKARFGAGCAESTIRDVRTELGLSTGMERENVLAREERVRQMILAGEHRYTTANKRLAEELGHGIAHAAFKRIRDELGVPSPGPGPGKRTKQASHAGADVQVFDTPPLEKAVGELVAVMRRDGIERIVVHATGDAEYFAPQKLRVPIP